MVHKHYVGFMSRYSGDEGGMTKILLPYIGY